MTRRTTLYGLLGVPPSATADEIRAAYRHAARELHPDAGGSAAAFQRLTTAYHILGDPAGRAGYDEYLATSSARVAQAADGAQPGDGPPPPAAFPGASREVRRGYLVMTTVALGLFILAGTVVRPVSVPAAIAMAVVAMVIPPIAAIVANRPPPTRGTRRKGRSAGHRAP
ncbi:J domain-containing protein [Pseudofrankia sp. DC12]|uniref:J domain-containing protein n=1 Tax=Pseudofrankia sp. DC12 TaxID=683315 RepID=UPI0005F7D4DA|nr:J domain-containing protein [Pseudofrankia sp. DC12]